MIVTASHCFRDRPFADGWKFRFTPAYANGQQPTDPTRSHFTRTGLTGRIITGKPGSFDGSGAFDTVAGRDLAICEQGTTTRGIRKQRTQRSGPVPRNAGYAR